MAPKRGTRYSNSKKQKPKQESENELSEEVESEEEKYNVEKIIDKRAVMKGNRRVYQYLVKWEGYPSSQNTWEPTSNLTGCGDMLKNFNAQFEKEKSLKLSRKSLERLSRSPSSKRKRTSASPKRNKKQKVESEEEEEEKQEEEEEEEEEDNDSSDYEVTKPRKSSTPRKTTPKKKGRKRKATYSVRSPRRPRTPTRKSPRRRASNSSKIFHDDDNIVVEDPHFSSHQSEEDKERIREYLEKLKEMSKSSTIKLLNPSQLLAAQSLTSKLTLQITHNLTQSLSLIEEEEEEEEEEKKRKDDDDNNDENDKEDDKQKEEDNEDEGIPLPVDDDEIDRMKADEKAMDDIILEHENEVSFDD